MMAVMRVRIRVMARGGARVGEDESEGKGQG